jgi:hypothetical protein
MLTFPTGTGVYIGQVGSNSGPTVVGWSLAPSDPPGKHRFQSGNHGTGASCGQRTYRMSFGCLWLRFAAFYIVTSADWRPGTPCSDRHVGFSRLAFKLVLCAAHSRPVEHCLDAASGGIQFKFQLIEIVIHCSLLLAASMDAQCPSFWGVFLILLMVVSSKNLARSGLLSAASSTSTTVRAALEEDDEIIYLLAATEACAGVDSNTFSLDREINGEFYIKPRSIGRWDFFAANELDGERWHKLLRVSRDTFQYLVNELTFDLKTNVPFSFSQIPNRVLTVPRQIAMSLNRLATGHSMFAISELFGVTEATVTLTTRKFVEQCGRL